MYVIVTVNNQVIADNFDYSNLLCTLFINAGRNFKRKHCLFRQRQL